MGCGSDVVKYLVFIFNLVFALVGLALLIAGIVFKFTDLSNLGEFAEVKHTAIAIIVVGAIIFVISFFGCCGAIRESTCMLSTFAFILLGLFIIQLALGIIIFVAVNGMDKTKDSKHDSVVKHIYDLVNKYESDKDSKELMDTFQITFKCCGSKGPSDYHFNNGSVPISCCEDKENCTPTSQYIHREGCADKIYDFIKHWAKVIAIVIIVIAGVEIIGGAVACCLSSSLKNQYRRGGYA